MLEHLAILEPPLEFPPHVDFMEMNKNREQAEARKTFNKMSLKIKFLSWSKRLQHLRGDRQCAINLWKLRRMTCEKNPGFI